MKKKLFILIFAVLFLLPHAPALAAGTATVSVEAFPVGAGYLVSPMQVETDASLTAAEVLLDLLAKNGYTAYYGGTPQANFYLAYVADGDKTGDYNGYRCAAALYPVQSPKKLRYRTAIASPLRDYLAAHAGYFDENDYEENAPGYLGEFVYTDLSGWMYSLNGAFLQKDLSGVKLQAGDTLRLQFTLCLGADIGGADADVQAAYDAAMRAPETTTKAPETTTEAPETTTKPPETTTKAPETTTKAPETTTAAPETTTKVPETTTKAPETMTQAPETTAASPESTAQEESASAEETPSSAQGPATEETPSAAAPESESETAPLSDSITKPPKRLTGVLITVITAAAAVPVAAAAAIIVKKKKRS